jgi:hypothetical protein
VKETKTTIERANKPLTHYIIAVSSSQAISPIASDWLAFVLDRVTFMIDDVGSISFFSLRQAWSRRLSHAIRNIHVPS